MEGEKHLQLNADNCAGQNKNNYLLWYLSWRVDTGLHTTVELSFLLAGHTKFAPDWCFGLIKRLFRRTKVSCLKDISDVVENSTQQGINIPQLVGDESGKVFIPVYDWVNFLLPVYTKFVGLKKQHHFLFSADQPGCMRFKRYAESNEETYRLRKKEIVAGMPEIIQPDGLDAARKKYLYEQIREFCSDETKDLVCPCPVADAAEPCVSAPEPDTEAPLSAGISNQKKSSCNQGRGKGKCKGRATTNNKQLAVPAEISSASESKPPKKCAHANAGSIVSDSGRTKNFGGRRHSKIPARFLD